MYIYISNEYVLVPYTFIYGNCTTLLVQCEATRSRSAAVPPVPATDSQGCVIVGELYYLRSLYMKKEDIVQTLSLIFCINWALCIVRNRSFNSQLFSLLTIAC